MSHSLWCDEIGYDLCLPIAGDDGQDKKYILKAIDVAGKIKLCLTR